MMMVKGEQGTGEDLHTRQCMYYGHERIGNFDTNDWDVVQTLDYEGVEHLAFLITI